jgi:phospholipid/cholesterol/gamma-HCH transport system substrate-binding protein
MEDKANAGLVGAFVLLLGAVLVAGVLWLAAGMGSGHATDPYEALIQESVAGLHLDAPVKYLGVDVGKVSRIEIDPQNSRQVRLRFLIERGTPVKQDTVAVLKTQGLTGIAFVEINGGSPGALPLLPGPDGRPPIIPFKLSLTARLENVVTNVLGNVDRVSNNLNAVFDKDNQLALKAMLTDLAAVAHALDGQKAALSTGIADAARTAHVAASAAEHLTPALDRVAAGASAVQRMADVAADASSRAASAADAAASGVQQLGSETLPELTRLMGEVNQLAASLRRLSEQTTTSPSSLIVGRPAPRPGPGESPTP